MSARNRARAFSATLGIDTPILLAPMAGASAPALSIAVANAGGFGACGALLMQPDDIRAWAATVRAASGNRFQLNLWVPDPPPVRDNAREAAVRGLLRNWGPEVPAAAGDATPPDFGAQCDALLEIAAPVVSSVMGLFPAPFVERAHANGIKWFAIVTTLRDARLAEDAGADAVVVQGMEAGGHRGAFVAADAEREMVGLFSLLPVVVDRVKVPVIAAGGIADGRGVAAALTLGASAVAIGTGFLRCPEAQIHPAWADAIGRAAPEQTTISRVFSGRPGRSIRTKYVEAATAPDAPPPADYPVQRGLTSLMRREAASAGDVDRMQPWAGQSSLLASAEPAADLLRRMWADAQTLLP
ncbi:MAG TPA: nitronate monooxygenase [Vicinamibacterales bacterium]|nr:nitronate monooxygenase [Vicinamibacterales bacterium]